MKYFAKHYPVVWVTLIVGAVVLALWLAGNGNWAQTLATIYVGGFVLWTAIGMVKDMLAGNFGLDILAVVAMVATLAVGEYGASIIIVLMLSGGEALEDYAAGRATRELTSLLENAPQTAHLVNPETGETEDVPATQVQVGDELVVRPGELVPVDCELLSARGSFDESSLTGEPLPQTRVTGQEVPSGAVNGSELVRVRALRVTADSQYQQIIQLVREAEKSQSPIVRLADRFAVPFTIIALAIGGIAWAVSGDPVRFAQVLVLATPCPLLIAAPVAFMGGLSFSAKNGIIFKGGAILEQLAEVKSAGFDKTGTITSGRPLLDRLVPAPGISDHELLTVAAAAEQNSVHVLAGSIVEAAAGQSLPAVTEASEVPGRGVEALVDGATVRVGKASFVASDVDALELEAGEVAVYVGVDGTYIGGIVLKDEVRPEASQVIAYLREDGVETIEMITGDAQATADAVARQAGVTQVLAGVKPQEKVAAVAALAPKPSLMVGDGVNDAPALAAANVGIAMGARGATAAGEAADAVITQDSLSKIGDARAISRHTVRVALTAIWIGIILSVGLMLVATTGVIPAVVGALTQELVDLATILYALRALRAPLPTWDHKA